MTGLWGILRSRLLPSVRQLLIAVALLAAGAVSALAALDTPTAHHANRPDANRPATHVAAVRQSTPPASPRVVAGPARASAGQAGKTVPGARFAALLTAGLRAAAKGNVNFGEILGIAAPGGGEVLRIRSAWNAAKGIEASAIDEESGLLRTDAKAVRSISVQTLAFGRTAYIHCPHPGATGGWS
jgi:hypothetical protein